MRIFYTAMAVLLLNSVYAKTDTLRHYNTDAPLAAAAAGYKEYTARFELKQPGWVQSISVWMDGSNTNGTATLKIYGHEGGVSFPQLEKALIPSIIFHKTTAGRERITVRLKDSLWLDNNQFFVSIRVLTENTVLLADKKSPNSDEICESASGGSYYYFFMKNNNDQWLLGNKRALAIDVAFSKADPVSAPFFRDVTTQAGISPDIFNRSVAWSDFNKDNFLDFIASGRLYRSNGEGTFTEITLQTSIQQAKLVANAFIDMNNDGYEDILLLYADSSTHKLLINNGNGTFTEKKLGAQIPVKGMSSFSIADVNNDGYPDIFIGRLWTTYPAGGPDIVPNYLYQNTGNNDFSDASLQIYPVGYAHRRSRGSAWCDFDNDGDLDLYVANYYLEPDELWKNNGNGTFTDIAALKSIDINNYGGSGNGTGCDWGDYDNDGNFDLLLPMLAHPAFLLQYDHRPTTIYRNSGAPFYSFTDECANVGIEYEEAHAGAAWGDVNNDGLLDFAVTTFYGCRYVELYHQNPDHTFSIQTHKYGIQQLVTGEEATWVDYDNDGRLDLVLGDNGKFRLYKNEHPGTGNYVQMELSSVSKNKLAVGARVYLYAGGMQQVQEVTAGRGVCSQKPARLHFGIGNAQGVDSVLVHWPGDTTPEKINGILVNRLHFIKENTPVRVSTGMPLPENHIAVYPVPFREGFFISTENELLSHAVLRIADVQGREVYAQELSLAPGTPVYIAAAGLAPGAYVYQLWHGSKVYRGVIIRN